MNKVARSFICIFLILSYETVFGSGFQLAERSTRGMGRAFSGEAAIADDASVIASNPAGMILLDNKSFSMGVTYIKPNTDVKGKVSHAESVNDNNIVPEVFVPYFYYSQKFSEKIVFGFGAFTAYGLKTNYSDIFADRSITNFTALETINFNPSVAYRINEKWSIGTGFNVLYAKGKITGNAVPSITQNNFSFKGNDWGYGYNLGVLYEFNNETRFGLHFRSKIDTAFSGDYIGSASGGTTISEKVQLEIPATLEFSVLYELSDQWYLHGDIIWTDWSSFKKLTTSSPTEINNTENWKDTVRLSIGTTYKHNEKLIVRGGFAYDDSPIRSAKLRTLRLPDNDRYWLSIGASYQVYRTYHLDLAYTHIFINEANISEQDTGNGIFTGTAETNVNMLAIAISGSF